MQRIANPYIGVEPVPEFNPRSLRLWLVMESPTPCWLILLLLQISTDNNPGLVC